MHTHYDGQAVWDPLLAPSLWHGVTTVVMGNCGVGFAPVRPNRREYLITMMESVEDIPRQSLSAGINWQWETFPEYLDALAAIPRTIDVGTQVPHAEKMQALWNPDVRRRLLQEEDPTTAGISILYKQASTWQMTFPMGEPLNYFPDPQHSVAAIAARRGCTAKEAVYDLLLENDGRAFLMYAIAGYAEGSRDPLYEMLTHPLTVMGGSDSGAHMRFICDGSAQTFMLTTWVRDCAKGDRYHLPIEFVVKKQSHDTARLFGMYDRGTLEAGMKADLNLIDLNALRIDTPTMINDLPAGMPRLMQTAHGYVATLVSSEVIQENGIVIDARPGKVVRGTETP